MAIGRALDVLKAWAEGRPQYAFLAERRRRHIQAEAKRNPHAHRAASVWSIDVGARSERGGWAIPKV